MAGFFFTGLLLQCKRPVALPMPATPFFRGRGTLAGTFPDGVTSVSGVPTSADVVVQARAPGFSFDGTTLARTTSNASGEWLVENLDPARTYTVLAQLAGECDVAKSEVAPLSPLVFTLPTFFVVRISEDRTFQLAASGGEGPYTFAVTAGTLPSGVALVGDQLVGTAPIDTPGDYPVTIEVTDARANTVSADISVRLVYISLRITSTLRPNEYTVLPNATAFTHSVTGVAGTAPYTYAVTAGSLPAGVSLNTSTGALTGTTTTEDDYAFTITVTDAVSATRSLSFIVLVTSIVPHCYWRLSITNGNGNMNTSLIALEFRIKHLGTDVPASSVMFANSEYSASYQTAYAFDGVSGTRWAAAGSAAPFTPYPHTIGRALPSPVPIFEVSLTGGPTVAQSPSAFDVQSSDDGVTWTSEWSVTGQTGWTAGQTRVFTRP